MMKSKILPTGMRQVRVTSSANNLHNPDSRGSTNYQAQGLLKHHKQKLYQQEMVE